MTQIIFVRHGEPTYEHVRAKGYAGHGLAFAQLTEEGKRQAAAAAENPILHGAEVLLSSPYTRALETAAILSRRLDMDIRTELDLHEWEPDLSYRFTTKEESVRAYELCAANQGRCPPDAAIRYEELESVFNRVKSCLLKYTGYQKIIAVSHGVAIRQFTKETTPFCAVVPVEFSPDTVWQGFLGRM